MTETLPASVVIEAEAGSPSASLRAGFRLRSSFTFAKELLRRMTTEKEVPYYLPNTSFAAITVLQWMVTVSSTIWA